MDLVRLAAAASPTTRGAAVLYLSSLAPGSRSTMAGAARDIARFFGSDDAASFAWHSLRFAHTQAVRSWVAERYAVATANRYLACLRGVLRQCYRLDLISEHDYARAIDLEPVRGSAELAGRALSAGEIRTLFASCDTRQTLGARNAALLALLFGAGLRRAEVVALDFADLEADRVRVRRGKGRKARTVFLPDGAIAALRVWVAFRGEEPGPLLYPTFGGAPSVRGIRRERRMCRDNVRTALRAMARRAGIELCSPHDARRTYIGDCLDAGLDLSAVQDLVGHAQTNTTKRYDRRPERARARVRELLVVPFVDRRRPDESGDAAAE